MPNSESNRLGDRWDFAAAMAGKLAHDLGNVFMGVNGFAELAMLCLEPEHAARSHIGDALAAGRRGLELTQRLHLLRTCASHATSDASVLRTLGQIEERWRNDLPQEINWTIDVAAELPSVQIAPEPLSIAIVQFLNNAFEACGDGGVVTVSASVIDLTAARVPNVFGRVQPGRHVELKIADSGPGVPAAIASDLVRVPMVTTKSGHRGLGLGIAFRALNAHRAGFTLETGPSGGGLVTIFLPCE